jgi:hypothetical protein
MSGGPKWCADSTQVDRRPQTRPLPDVVNPDLLLRVGTAGHRPTDLTLILGLRRGRSAQARSEYRLDVLAERMAESQERT